MITVKDYNLVNNFSQTYGIGQEFTNKIGNFMTIYEGVFPRKVILDITTWRGVTTDALHYYGTLKIASLKCQNLTTGKTEYLGSNAPSEAKGLTIELTRPLCKKDMMIDEGERFKGATLGERVKNFDSIKQVESAAIELFNSFFLEGWSLIRLKPQQAMSFGGVVITNDEVILSNHHLAV